MDLPFTTQHQTQYRGTMQKYSDAKINRGHYNAGVANVEGKACQQGIKHALWVTPIQYACEPCQTCFS